MTQVKIVFEPLHDLRRLQHRPILPGYVSDASLAVGEREQGAVAGLVGVAQGAGSVLGPPLGTTLYTLGITLPYAVVAALLLAATAFVWSRRTLAPSSLGEATTQEDH